MSATPSPVTDVSAFVEACKIVGGQAEMARRLRVTPAAINQICTGKRPLPPGWCPDIERETRAEGTPIVCERLAPAVNWGVVRSNPVACDALPADERLHDLGPAARAKPQPPADHPRRRAYEQPQPAQAAGGEG